MREALRIFRSAVLLALVASPAFAAAETLQSANVDNRLMLFVQAPEAAVKKRLPSGFQLSAFGEGPYQGTNVILAFFERLHASDAAGKAQAAVQNRSLLLVIPVKNPAGSLLGFDQRGARSSREFGLGTPCFQAFPNSAAWLPLTTTRRHRCRTTAEGSRNVNRRRPRRSGFPRDIAAF